MNQQRNFEVKVNCIIDGRFCGRCCYQTEMPLTNEDIERIEKLGYKRQEFAVKVNGIYRLRNINGKCYFLDESNRCRIYDHRPIGCRIYPVILDVETNRAIVDDLCPMKDSVSRKDIKSAEKILRKLVKEVYSQELPQ
jgi:Fe-S-cluster containining protein